MPRLRAPRFAGRVARRMKVPCRSSGARAPPDLHRCSRRSRAAREDARGMTTTAHRTGHDWRTAGEAWGHAAADWACLYEHYAFDVITAVFDRVGIEPGVRLLDVACGSGLAVRHATGRGATAAGVDAAAALVQIARDRNP